MKAPPNRKGNPPFRRKTHIGNIYLNESPYEKAGKCALPGMPRCQSPRLNESPSGKEGKFLHRKNSHVTGRASMKAPTKKQGNNVDGESFETTRVPQ